MSRWIDADALIEKIPTVMDMQDVYLPIHFKAWLIDEAPSIDIVRCKECEHGTYCEEAEMYICSANDQDLYEAEHFCSYGERRAMTNEREIIAKEWRDDNGILHRREVGQELIRCKECKYWEESQYYQEFMVCTYVKGATFTRQHDDFCSRGERKESE